VTQFNLAEEIKMPNSYPDAGSNFRVITNNTDIIEFSKPPARDNIALKPLQIGLSYRGFAMQFDRHRLKL
jgi:hypothetical protein